MGDTKELIQERLLGNVDNIYDKSIGGFFYDVTKTVSIEAEKIYTELDEVLKKAFVDTAEGEYLDKKVAEQGVYRKQATYASDEVVITGAAGAVIKKNDKVASDIVNFVFLEDKAIDDTGKAVVKVKCEKEGAIGNVPIGAIKYFPVTLEGLYTVKNETAFSNGYDVETDESLRQRYYDKVRTPATSGNKYHYINWAKEVIGVGDAKVFPLWNGNSTVKVLIVDSNKRAADNELINLVTEHIETNRPIGANVTVVSAVEKPINISITLIVDTKKYTFNDVKMAIEDNLKKYFSDIAFINNYVSYASIGNLIFNIDGVIDYSNLLVNGGTSNIGLTDEEIPVLGTVELGV